MTSRYFIAATGTDIGKTFITAALVRQAKVLGKSVMAYKPAITGFDPAKPETSDTGILLQALDLPATPENIERMSPWRYAAPLAPSMATRLENRPIDFDKLCAWSGNAANGPEDIIMIEAVGGIMVPLDDRHTTLDWVEATGIPALVVIGSYLGTISHTLTTLAVLEQRKIPVAALIINESENSTVSLQSTAEELKIWTRAPVLSVKRRHEADGWKNIPELASLVKGT